VTGQEALLSMVGGSTALPRGRSLLAETLGGLEQFIAQLVVRLLPLDIALGFLGVMRLTGLNYRPCYWGAAFNLRPGTTFTAFPAP
jgi:hypothetical protein